jgi:serine protease AprX
MSAEDEPVTIDVEEPEPLPEAETVAVRRAPKGDADRSSVNLKVIAVALAVIVVSVVIWQAWFTDPDRSEWAFEVTQVNDANDAGYTGRGITVGIVDTGIDADHKIFKDANVVKWKDFVNGRSQPYDDQGHGTAMATFIAGQDPLPGAAMDVDLIIVKVLNSNGEGTDSMVAQGINYCVDPNGDGNYADGADIISLSLGGRTSYLGILIGSESQAAIHRAADLGVYCVAAAGNDGRNDDGDVASPGWFADVICVGAVGEDGKIASFSSKGRNILKQDPNRKPEVVAPGVDLVQASPGGGYAIGSGTSQATAFMSGCLALVLDAHPELARGGAQGGNENTIYVVKWAIKDSAKKIPGQNSPHDNRAGYGLVQTMDLIDELS